VDRHRKVSTALLPSHEITQQNYRFCVLTLKNHEICRKTCNSHQTRV